MPPSAAPLSNAPTGVGPPAAARGWADEDARVPLLGGRGEARGRPRGPGRPGRDGLDHLGDLLGYRVVDHMAGPRDQPEIGVRELLPEPDGVPADIHDLVLAAGHDPPRHVQLP